MSANSTKKKIVIMAGGKGERFWPKSRLSKPKQFAKIINDKTMLENTVERLLAHLSMNNIYISVGNDFADKVNKLFSNLPKENLILEPMARDTAAAIALAIMTIEADDDDVLFFIPADHYIDNLKIYHRNIEQGAKIARETKKLVLLGIVPSSPSENFGYMEIKRASSGNGFYSVVNFKEKPDLKTAQSYLDTGNYLWNAGMFFMRKDTALSLLNTHIPASYEKLTEYLHWQKKGEQEKAKQIFASLDKISFDYAVVEKTQNIACLKADFVWDDVGSWNALSRLIKTDDKGNILSDNSLVYDCKNVIVDSDNDNFRIVLNGLTDINVVLDENVLYICHKDKENEIKKILKKMAEGKNKDLL